MNSSSAALVSPFLIIVDWHSFSSRLTQLSIKREIALLASILKLPASSDKSTVSTLMTIGKSVYEWIRSIISNGGHRYMLTLELSLISPMRTCSQTDSLEPNRIGMVKAMAVMSRYSLSSKKSVRFYQTSKWLRKVLDKKPVLLLIKDKIRKIKL